MISDFPACDAFNFEIAGLNQPSKQSRMMDDVEELVRASVLISQSIEAVRIGRHDAFESAAVDRFDIRLRQGSKKALLAGPAHVVSGISFGVIKNSKINTRSLKQPCDLASCFLHSRVVRGVVAYKP